MQNGKLNICIIAPDKDAYTETFIHAHITALPANTRSLYGGTFPVFTDKGSRLLELPVLPRIKRVIEKKLYHLSEDQLKNIALIRFFRENAIQAVLAEYGPTGVAVSEVCKEAGVPLIVHFHGYDAYEHKTLERFKEGYKKIFQYAAAIIAVSKDMEKQLISLGAPQNKVYWNPYGVDLGKFSGAQPAKALAVFAAAGRFVDKKAPHLTILAFHQVWQKYPQAKLVMIGDGPLWEACRQLAGALGMDHAVELLGKCPHEQIANIMRASRAFVQHSLRTAQGDSEGTPVAVLEAGASGLPVVATRHAGIQDVVVDNQTGFLVDERDVAGMAKRMMQLCEDPILAGELGKAARERIKVNYSMERSSNNLIKIIQESIHG